MNRSWIGVILLLLLLVTGIWITVSSSRIHEDISRQLSSAGASALDGDWTSAASFARAAKEAWETRRQYTASITDHSPMEQIDGMFAQMEVYLQARQRAAFCACCAELEVMVQAVGESQSINWWNLL